NAVIPGGRATLRDRYHVGKKPLIGRLRGVGRQLQQEVAGDQPPVVAGERDADEEEQIARCAGGDERTPAPPGRDGAVRNASNDRLPQDRDQRPERLEKARGQASVSAADELN